MDPRFLEQVAAFRYSLIAPIVSRQTPMLPGETKAYLEEAVNKVYDIPGSVRNRVGMRTLERYLSRYRKHGWEGLKPTPRKTKVNSRIPADVLQKAIELRRQRPERSVEQLIFILEETGGVPQGSIAASTLSRQLRKAGVSRCEILKDTHSPKGHRRFEAEDVHVLWQADFQHTLYMPDPSDPKRRKKAMLFAIIDDFSRLLVHCQFYWDEKLPRLEDSFKKAILKHGIPEQLYVDNGAVFSSHHLARVCGRLGVRLSHSRPYRPAGRGKIERLFRFIDTSFKPEAYEQIAKGKVTTLDQLNEALTAWVDGYYHQRRHGATGKTPLERAALTSRQLRRKTITELTEIFLWEDRRKVDKTGCIQLYGNIYEVDLGLVGEHVVLRYDPFDLKVIQVWWGEKRFPDARPVDLTRPYHRKAALEKPQKLKSEEHAVQFSFFDLAEQRRRAAWEEKPFSFARKGEGYNE